MTRKLEAVLTASLMIVALTAVLASPAGAGEHRIGAGVNYWKTIDDLDDEGFENIGDIDDSGIAEVVSYQYWPKGLIGFEVDLEHFPDGFGGSTDDAWSPQVYITLGHGIYGGLGVGVTNSSDFEGDWSDPFYAAKLGFNMALLPHISLDLYGNYRFDAWSELNDADTDTVFLGALVRVTF